MAADNVQHQAAVKTASPSPAAMTEEQRKKFYAELRARLETSPLKVLAPPGVTPYWARKEDENELSRLDILGFQIVKEHDPAHPRFKARGLRADGTYCVGDVILMEIPTETYQFYMEQNHERSLAMVSGARENIRNEAALQNVPTFEVKK